MTSQEKLILFMQMKAEEISNLIDVDETAYFAFEDEVDLKRLSNEMADLIWLDLEDAVINRGSCGLDSDICPFCMAYGHNCAVCSYAKVHGNCLSPFSDYAQVMDKLRKKFGDDTIALPNSFYKDILEQINQKEENNDAK